MPTELTFLLVGFIAGCIFCWGLAYQYWKRKLGRRFDIDLDDGDWWDL